MTPRTRIESIPTLGCIKFVYLCVLGWLIQCEVPRCFCTSVEAFGQDLTTFDKFFGSFKQL